MGSGCESSSPCAAGSSGGECCGVEHTHHHHNDHHSHNDEPTTQPHNNTTTTTHCHDHDHCDSHNKETWSCQEEKDSCCPSTSPSKCPRSSSSKSGKKSTVANPTSSSSPRKSSGSNPSSSSKKYVCVAILRDNYGVDIYDAQGQVKHFSLPNHVITQLQSSSHSPTKKQQQQQQKSHSVETNDSKDSKNSKRDYSSSSSKDSTTTTTSTTSSATSTTKKLCFSSHGRKNVDDLLTPCFDDGGLHTTDDTDCFCGEVTPHIHCHLHLDDDKHDDDKHDDVAAAVVEDATCGGDGCCGHGVHGEECHEHDSTDGCCHHHDKTQKSETWNLDTIANLTLYPTKEEEEKKEKEEEEHAGCNHHHHSVTTTDPSESIKEKSNEDCSPSPNSHHHHHNHHNHDNEDDCCGHHHNDHAKHMENHSNDTIETPTTTSSNSSATTTTTSSTKVTTTTRQTRMYKIKHEDHYDTLVQNEGIDTTPETTTTSTSTSTTTTTTESKSTTTYHLEHDCHECGKVYMHGKLKFLNRRSWTYRDDDDDEEKEDETIMKKKSDGTQGGDSLDPTLSGKGESTSGATRTTTTTSNTSTTSSSPRKKSKSRIHLDIFEIAHTPLSILGVVATVGKKKKKKKKRRSKTKSNVSTSSESSSSSGSRSNTSDSSDFTSTTSDSDDRKGGPFDSSKVNNSTKKETLLLCQSLCKNLPPHVADALMKSIKESATSNSTTNSCKDGCCPTTMDHPNESDRHDSKLDISGGGCNHDHSHGHHHSHAHHHSHSHHHNHGQNHVRADTHTHNHSHHHDHGTTCCDETETQDSFTHKEEETDPSNPNVGRSSLRVPDICCASETKHINGILKPVNGIKNVSVNTTNKTVYVDHDFQIISVDKISSLLQSQGFGSTVLKDAQKELEKQRQVPTVMSNFVESTFVISSLVEEDCDKLQTYIQDMFVKSKVSHVETHLPSRTIKVDHNPQLLSSEELCRFMQGLGYKDASIAIDGFKEGIWTTCEDEDDCKMEDQGSKLHLHILLSGICWIVSMLHYIGDHWEYLKYVGILSVVLCLPKVALKAYKTLLRCRFDTNCMVVFATLGAVALQDFAEGAAVAFLFSISEWLENISTARARRALSAIVKLRPERAKVQDPVTKKYVIVPASSVAIGSVVSVRTGDKIPCDGIILSGISTVDESSLTGESRPVAKKEADKVLGGTINTGEAQLLVKTTSTAADSAVARLVHLVEEAQMNRSPTEQLVDSFAKRYTPAIVIAAISMCTIPWFWGVETGRQWTRNGLVLAVISCPCALIISTPVTYVAGLATAAQKGVVVKGGAHLEALGRVTKIGLDKTGTITLGSFQMLHLRMLTSNMQREEALKYLYAIESHATHPMAVALIEAAKNEGVAFPDFVVEKHKTLAGEGITAEIDGKVISVGNFRLFERLNMVDLVAKDELDIIKGWLGNGGTVGFLSVGDEIVCSFCVADAVRPESKKVISELHNLGIEVNMLTGDNNEAALSIGRAVGLDRKCVKSQLLPKDKLDLIQEMKEEEARKANETKCLWSKAPGLVLMCGDGVNDAPSLATSDVSIAMGKGAAMAMETADITLLDSNLNKLVMMITLAKRVTRTIIENVVFSIVAKAVVMGITFAGHGSLWLAISSDVGAMLCVTANGMKLLPSKKSIRDESGYDAYLMRDANV